MNKLEIPVMPSSSDDLITKRQSMTFNNIIDSHKQNIKNVVDRNDAINKGAGLTVGVVGISKRTSRPSESEKNVLRAIANGEQIITEEENKNEAKVDNEQANSSVNDIVDLIQKNVDEFKETFKLSGEQEDLESARYWENLVEEIKTPEGQERVIAFIDQLIVSQTRLLDEVSDLDVSIALRESIENKKRIKLLLIKERGEKSPVQETEMPTDSSGLRRYFVTTFKDIYRTTDVNEFLSKITPDVCREYEDWLKLNILAMASEMPEGARYPDTLASVIGNGSDELMMFQGVMALKDGHVSNITDELLRTPFSKLAKQYLNWDIGDDYFKTFSKRD